VAQDNVEIVQALYTAAAGRDAATVFSLYDPEVELDASQMPLGGLIGTQIRHGHQGVTSFFRDLHDAFENLEYEVERLIPAGEHVVSLVKRRGRGKASGLEFEVSFGVVFTVHAGRVIRVVWFPSRAEALKAVGLEE
jgi:ketosteroid isomerase-like protein